LGEIREVARGVALAVGLAAQKDGVAKPTSADDLHAKIVATQWVPAYE